jgi:hypothetical protein
VFKLALSWPSDATWVWRMSAESMGPVNPSPFHVWRNGTLDLLESLTAWVEHQIKLHVCSVADARLDVRLSDHGARLVSLSIDKGYHMGISGLELDSYRTDVDISAVPAWVDAGLRAEFSFMAPLQGPFPSADLECALFDAIGSSAHGRHLLLVQSARAELEAQSMRASTRESKSAGLPKYL